MKENSKILNRYYNWKNDKKIRNLNLWKIESQNKHKRTKKIELKNCNKKWKMKNENSKIKLFYLDLRAASADFSPERDGI